MKFLTYLFLFLFVVMSCQSTNLVPLNKQETLTIIAFGSCNDEDKEQPMWSAILENRPDLWIWLGDNIYGDSEDIEVLKAKYTKQQANQEYQKLLKSTPIVGIWDDHDYGANDGDKNFSIKKESKELMLDFLGVDKNESVWSREGAYQSYTFGRENQKVKVILLDVRYFRDELEPNPEKGGQRYLINEKGDILGEAQWKWFEDELINSDAQIHIIGSGIQMIPEEHFFEKWSNFPVAHKRLMDVLVSTKAKNAILLSGDRHIAEISKVKRDGLNYPLYEITASGLTHSYEKIREVGEANQHRVGDKYTGEKNFGLFTIDWSANPLKVKAEIRGLENKAIFEEVIQF